MNIENIITIAIAFISIMANIMQFVFNKKSTDIKTLNEQVKLLGKLQEEQSKAYEREKLLQERELGRLKIQYEEQKIIIKNTSEEVSRLQRVVNKLIGQGCHIDDCVKRSPYTLEEINEINKKSKRNNK